MSLAEDRELAGRAAKGDREASLQFLRDYQPSVFRYTSSLVASREDAEDLAAEAIVHAHTKLGSFRGDSSLRTWVHRIAFHTFTHWMRKQRKHERLGPEVREPHSQFRPIDDSEAIRSALSRLPETLRQPFILCHVNELSHEEVASILGIPSGTVKSRIHYARVQLRELLEPPTEEPNVQLSLISR